MAEADGRGFEEMIEKSIALIPVSPSEGRAERAPFHQKRIITRLPTPFRTDL
jgi:hypothetical protein